MSEKQLPYSADAEQAMIGSMIMAPNEAIQIVRDSINELMIFDARNKRIFTEILSMFDNQEPIDLVTLVEKLTNCGALDKSGGPAYLSAMIDMVPSVGNIRKYIDIVKEKFQRRNVIKTAMAAMAAAYDESVEIQSVIAEVESGLNNSRDGIRVAQETIKEIVFSRLDEYSKIHSGEKNYGIKTGFPDLDEKLGGGLKFGSLVILAARPALGKSALTTSILLNVATNGVPVGLIGREMSNSASVDRMMANWASVNMTRITDWQEAEFERCAEAAHSIKALPIYLDDNLKANVAETCTMIRRWHERHGAKLFVIDLFTRMRMGGDSRADFRREAVNRAIAEVKALTALGVVIVAAVHLGRQADEETPRLNHLRETGNFEEDGDTIVLIRRSTHEDADNPDPVVMVTLDIAKNKYGKSGTVGLIFDREHSKFRSAPRVA